MEEDCQRKGAKNTGLEGAGWESIYCSLILILVAFFAMLVSYTTKEGKTSGTKTNYMRGFGVEAMFSGTGKTSEGDVSNLVASSGIEAIALTAKALKRYVEASGLSESIHIEKTDQGLKIIFEDTLLFPPGKARLNKNTYTHLDQIIELLKPNPFSIRVEGHTDDIPIHTPEFPSNWELSTARAVGVLRYILKTEKIQADRLEAVGCGPYRPVASNTTVEGRKKKPKSRVPYATGKGSAVRLATDQKQLQIGGL